MAEQLDRDSVDCIITNTLVINEKAFLDTNKHADEVKNLSSSASFDQPIEHSTSIAIKEGDVNDEAAQSVGEAADSADVAYDHDEEHDVAQKKALIDCVFFACDSASIGTVVVSDIISYLSNTLHVSIFPAQWKEKCRSSTYNIHLENTF